MRAGLYGLRRPYAFLSRETKRLFLLCWALQRLARIGLKQRLCESFTVGLPGEALISATTASINWSNRGSKHVSCGLKASASSAGRLAGVAGDNPADGSVVAVTVDSGIELASQVEG